MGHLRQQAGDEAVRLEEGAHEGEGQAEGGRSLDHPSLLQLQVALYTYLCAPPPDAKYLAQLQVQ